MAGEEDCRQMVFFPSYKLQFFTWGKKVVAAGCSLR